MDNQTSYLTDKSSEYRSYHQQENYHDSQANEESENNLKPLKMYEEDEDQNDENSDQEQEINEDQPKSENSFNDRMSDFDLDAQEHFASVYKDSNLNISDEDYNDRDMDNNSYINCVYPIQKPLQSSELISNQGTRLSREEDNFLKEVIRESEDLQKQLRMLDQYYQPQSQEKSKEEQQLPLSSAKQTPKKIQVAKQIGLEKEKKGNKEPIKKEIQSSASNQKSEKPIKSLNRNDSKKQLIQTNKDMKSSTETRKLSKGVNDQEFQKRQIFHSEQQSSQPQYHQQLDNRVTYTEPFSVPQQEQLSSKRKISNHLKIKEEGKKIRSRNNSSSGQARSKSRGKEEKPKSNNNLTDTPNTISEKNKKNKVLSKSKKEQAVKKKHNKANSSKSKEQNQSQVQQSDQKQQVSMNPLLMISDFDDNLKNSFNDQSNTNMLQQFMIKNDINNSYSPNSFNNNTNYEQDDYPTVSNISTNHQFFHNEYLQDQVPNFENESEEFEEQDDYHQDDSSEQQNSSSYSKFSHVYDSDEENKYPLDENNNDEDNYQQYYSNQSNQGRTQQTDFNSTGDFQQIPEIINQPFVNGIKRSNQNTNKYQISYQDNTRLNNYFSQPRDSNSNQNNNNVNNINPNNHKRVNQTQFTFNSTIDKDNDSRQKDIENIPVQNKLFLQTDGISNSYQKYTVQEKFNTTDHSPNNGIYQHNKLLGSSSSARLRNADSNSLWDLSLDNEPLQDNQMNIAELKQSQKAIQKKSMKKTKGAPSSTQIKTAKMPKKKKDLKKKVSSSHSIKDPKSTQTTQRKGKETINSKNSFNNPNSEKHIESEAHFYSANSNEQNMIQQLEKQIEEKDLLIDILKQQNNSLKQKLIQVQKSKQSHTGASNQAQLHNGLAEQLNIAKRLQETNKILIDRIKELDAQKTSQADLIDSKAEQYKILRQKYNELKKAFKSKVKRNIDLKKENELIKQIKSEIPPQNIDYTQIVQALAQISQNTELKDHLLSQGREDMSRGTFYTQRSSALGDYPDNKQQPFQNNIIKTQPDLQKKKNSSNHQGINYDNYYNQSIQNIQSSSKYINNNLPTPTQNNKKSTNVSKKLGSTSSKTPKTEKIKQMNNSIKQTNKQSIND